MRAAVLASLSLALVVSACNRKDAEGEAPPAGEAAGSSNSAAAPATPPKRRPGLWEMRTSMQDVDFVQTTRVCLDEATEAKLSMFGANVTKDMCEKNLVTRQIDGSWRFSSVCDMGSGGKTTTSGVATGDFSSKYQVRAESSTTGAATPQMNRQSTVVIDAAWQGPCPAGMKGGDMTLPGGGKINMLEMTGAG